MLIIGPPTAQLERVAYNLARVASPAPLFVDEMLPELWDAALVYGVDPVVVVAQSGKETAWGRFLRADGTPGRVRADMFNTCGLKIRVPSLAGDQESTLAHAQFASWWAGSHAHVQHLLAYCQRDLPAGVGLLDPRWVWVRRSDVAPVGTVAQLGGRWAPSPTYGTEIEATAAKLADRT